MRNKTLILSLWCLFAWQSEARPPEKSWVFIQWFEKPRKGCNLSGDSIGYDYRISTGDSTKLREVADQMDAEFRLNSGFGRSNFLAFKIVKIEHPVVCIISYVRNKEKGCASRHYVFGFGTTEAEAEKAARQEIKPLRSKEYTVSEFVRY